MNQADYDRMHDLMDQRGVLIGIFSMRLTASEEAASLVALNAWDEVHGDELNDLIVEAMEVDQQEYDESMDGDHESALASAGWGTDEDYGLFDNDMEW